MTRSDIAKRRKELVDAHQEVAMAIALTAIRINEMQKMLSAKSDQILMIEAELEKIKAEEDGKGFN